MVKAEIGAGTKTKNSEDNIASFMEKTKGTSPGIAWMPKRLKKGSKPEQMHSLRRSNP